MDNITMTKAQRREACKSYLTNQPEWGVTHLEYLGGGEWEDTDAEFAPGVLALFPRIATPPAGTAKVATGYGDLCAIDEGGSQIAWYDGKAWQNS